MSPQLQKDFSEKPTLWDIWLIECSKDVQEETQKMTEITMVKRGKYSFPIKYLNRLDMAGSLLSGLYRQLFRNFVDEMLKILKRDIDAGKTDLNLLSAMKSDLITRGLRSALATGNWGKDKSGDV